MKVFGCSNNLKKISFLESQREHSVEYCCPCSGREQHYEPISRRGGAFYVPESLNRKCSTSKWAAVIWLHSWNNPPSDMCTYPFLLSRFHVKVNVRHVAAARCETFPCHTQAVFTRGRPVLGRPTAERVRPLPATQRAPSEPAFPFLAAEPDHLWQEQSPQHFPPYYSLPVLHGELCWI